jgi:hypothetical protein
MNILPSQILFRCMPFMRTLLIISILLSFSQLSAQTVFNGRLTLQDTLFPNDGSIIFPLLSDTIKTDSYNQISIDLADSSHRIFYLIWTDWRSRVFRFTNGICVDTIYDIKIPDDNFYLEFQQKRVCPICFQAKYLIPIIYGLPDDKLIKQAKRNKVVLAGCITYDNSPKYFCTKDKFQF